MSPDSPESQPTQQYDALTADTAASQPPAPPDADSEANAEAGPGKPRRWKKILLILSLLVLALGVIFVLYIYALTRAAPDLDELQPRSAGRSSTVYADDGSRLGFIRADIARTPVRSQQIPPLVKRATIAIEDRRFYQHQGIDFLGILRAAVNDVRAGGVVEGGSTLTQQLAKNLYISDERSLQRKVTEAKIAQQLEEELSKEEILVQYLNNVPYGTANGQELIGIQAASRAYFNKSADQLRLAEVALLVGIPQAPTSNNPLLNPRDARTRRNDVLDALVRAGDASPKSARRAKRRGLGLKASDFFANKDEPYFFDYVQKQLEGRYGKRRVAGGGLKVYTTIKPRLQKAARESIASQLGERDDPAAAVVSIDPRNGNIVAMVSALGGRNGGASYRRSQFNYATQAKRQPGSTFKPMVLLAALDGKRVNLQRTTYRSKPLTLNTNKYGPIKVNNYGDSYNGNINLAEATVKSDNAVFQQLTLDIGPERVRETAKMMGVASSLEASPAIGLGGLKRGVTVLDMAHAYATLAADGIRSEPQAIKRVVFPGEKSDDTQQRRVPVFTDDTVAPLTAALRQNVLRGTGKKAQFGCPAAGKTGTTDDFKDAWFTGYTPRYATAVWVGYPQPKPMRGVHGVDVAGGTFPASIWGQFMKSATGGKCVEFASAEDDVKLKPYCGPLATTPKQRCLTARQRRQLEESRARNARRRQERAQDQQALADEKRLQQGDNGSDKTSDSSAPTVSILSAPKKSTTERAATFSFSTSESGAPFSCSLDRAAFSACSSGKSYSGLSSGSHSFRVRASDRAGNRGESSYNWRVRAKQ